MDKLENLGSDLRKYRTEVPNIILETDLSVYELALYVHLKRTAGDHGKSWKGTRKLARETKMSVGSAVKAKKGLIEKKLIEIGSEPHKNGADIIKIVDIWEKNFDHFRPSTAERGVHQVNGGVLPGERGVHQVNGGVSPGEQRKEHIKKEHIKNNQEEEKTTVTADVFSLYENEIRKPEGMEKNLLYSVIKEYPLDWIEKAINQCAVNNVRKMSYLKAILIRMKKDTEEYKI